MPVWRYQACLQMVKIASKVRDVYVLNFSMLYPSSSLTKKTPPPTRCHWDPRESPPKAGPGTNFADQILTNQAPQRDNFAAQRNNFADQILPAPTQQINNFADPILTTPQINNFSDQILPTPQRNNFADQILTTPTLQKIDFSEQILPTPTSQRDNSTDQIPKNVYQPNGKLHYSNRTLIRGNFGQTHSQLPLPSLLSEISSEESVAKLLATNSRPVSCNSDSNQQLWIGTYCQSRDSQHIDRKKQKKSPKCNSEDFFKIQEGETDHLFCSFTNSSSHLDPLHTFTRATREVEMCAFFHGTKSVQQIHDTLSNCPPGSFILRDSTSLSSVYTLTYVSRQTGGGLKNCRINFTCGKFRFDQFEEMESTSVIRLVEMFKQVHKYLTAPVLCRVPSLLHSTRVEVNRHGKIQGDSFSRSNQSERAETYMQNESLGRNTNSLYHDNLTGQSISSITQHARATTGRSTNNSDLPSHIQSLLQEYPYTI